MFMLLIFTYIAKPNGSIVIPFSASSSSLQSSGQACDVLKELFTGGSIFPFMQPHRFGFEQVACLNLSQVRHHFGVITDQRYLQIELEGADVQIA